MEQVELEGLEGAKKVGQNRTRTQRMFAEKLHLLSSDSQQKIRSKSAKFRDMVHYKAALLTGVLTELFGTNAAQRAVALTSVDRGLYPIDMIIDGIEVSYGTHATSTDPKAQDYTNIGETTDIPAAIRNGEIEIKLGGETVIKPRPLRQFFVNAKQSGGVAVSANGNIVVKLDSPEVFRKDEKTEIIIRTADGVALPAGNHFIRVDLHGTSIE